MAEKRSYDLDNDADEYSREQERLRIEKLQNSPETVAADALQRERREAREREQAAVREEAMAKQEARRLAEEAADKQSAWLRFAGTGGSREEFEALWPELRRQELLRRYDAARRENRRRGRASF